MKVTVKTDSCVGAGQCALVAGAVFDQDDDGIVVLLDPAPDASQASAVQRAAALCPARAISIHE